MAMVSRADAIRGHRPESDERLKTSGLQRRRGSYVTPPDCAADAVRRLRSSNRKRPAHAGDTTPRRGQVSFHARARAEARAPAPVRFPHRLGETSVRLVLRQHVLGKQIGEGERRVRSERDDNHRGHDHHLHAGLLKSLASEHGPCSPPPVTYNRPLSPGWLPAAESFACLAIIVPSAIRVVQDWIRMEAIRKAYGEERAASSHPLPDRGRRARQFHAGRRDAWVSQPALSQQIRQLEDDLGGQLFDRSGRTVRLTDFGLAYIGYARQALLDLEAGQRALHDVRDLSRGHVRLAITPTFTEYLVAPLVGQFRALHPGISIEIAEMSLEAIETALGDDQVDLAIGFSDVRSDDIEVAPLFAERLTLVAGGAHPLTRASGAVMPARLAELDLALLTSNFVARGYVDEYFRLHRIKPRIALQANSISAVLKSSGAAKSRRSCRAPCGTSTGTCRTCRSIRRSPAHGRAAQAPGCVSHGGFRCVLRAAGRPAGHGRTGRRAGVRGRRR